MGGQETNGEPSGTLIDAPLEIVDSSGALVSLDAPPQRVVSVAPNVTETVFALGRGNLLVGRSDWCDFPAEAQSITPVGNIQGPSVETIISLSPDLVLASIHAPMEEFTQLKAADIPAAVFYGPEEFSGAYDLIRGVALLLSAEDTGEAIISDMRERAAAVVQAVSLMDRKPSVYFVVGFGEGGDWTAGAGTFMDEMITMAGGINAAGDMEGWSYSLEKLLEKDPEVIIINAGLRDSFCRTPFYNELTAVREARVFSIDESLVVRQGPRLIDGLETLHEIFRTAVE